MQQQPLWFERADYAKISDLTEPSLVELFDRLEEAQKHFTGQLDRYDLQWELPWPQDALHQWSRQWEYPYVASAIPEKPAQILDAGSGFTFFTFYLAALGHEVYAVDCDPQLRKYYQTIWSNDNVSAKANKASPEGNVTFDIQDLHSLSFKSNSFDIVYCVSVLEHLSEKETVLREFARILRPGGLFVLTCDISLDGSTEISLPDFFDMLKAVDSIFEYASVPTFQMDDDTLTTNYCRKENPETLPWCKLRFRLRWLIHPRFYIQHERFTRANFCSLAVAGMKLRVKY